MALHRFYITTVYDEMNQPCAQWARSWHSHYGVRRNRRLSSKIELPHFFENKKTCIVSIMQAKTIQTIYYEMKL